jgi:hypothetical protein
MTLDGTRFYFTSATTIRQLLEVFIKEMKERKKK